MSAVRVPRSAPPRGRVTNGAPLAPLVWFKAGGPAEILFEPADVTDLSWFLADITPGYPVFALGLGSNLIVRDGGVAGVTIRLGKIFASIGVEGERLRAGAGAPGIKVASKARDAGIAGLEFLRGIPGTVGGAVRMNAGAYGRETADILVEATVVLRDGTIETWPRERFGYGYRHSAVPEGAVVVEALFEGAPGDRHAIGAEMDRIAGERESSQPLRSRTGGSTFKNPPGTRAWQLIDEAGCRGLQIGDAQVSEKHCNFLLNLGKARAAEIEALGQEVRRRVREASGIELEWEIQRVGMFADDAGQGSVGMFADDAGQERVGMFADDAGQGNVGMFADDAGQESVGMFADDAEQGNVGMFADDAKRGIVGRFDDDAQESVGGGSK
jgi:UDP-N-acetylmuramate dehydrogenase